MMETRYLRGVVRRSWTKKRTVRISPEVPRRIQKKITVRICLKGMRRRQNKMVKKSLRKRLTMTYEGANSP